MRCSSLWPPNKVAVTAERNSLDQRWRGSRGDGRPCAGFLEGVGAGREVLEAAAELKRQGGQINVTIHALGILLCLPHLLEPDECVEYLSLGAEYTSRSFDREANLRNCCV